jgi:hypothetical protein
MGCEDGWPNTVLDVRVRPSPQQSGQMRCPEHAAVQTEENRIQYSGVKMEETGRQESGVKIQKSVFSIQEIECMKPEDRFSIQSRGPGVKTEKKRKDQRSGNKRVFLEHGASSPIHNAKRLGSHRAEVFERFQGDDILSCPDRPPRAAPTRGRQRLPSWTWSTEGRLRT